MLEPWDAAAFRRSIENSLERARAAGASSTWVLSNHDLVRHASRFGLPAGTDLTAWLMSHGTEPAEDRALGLARARAGALLLLALPGSAYVYQGEELGLPEVADLPAAALQDPTWLRSRGAQKGRDGCRVPIPWTADGPSFGFGPGGSHLPQPAWFAESSVEAEDADPDSTLNLYRRALALRGQLLTEERLEWIERLRHRHDPAVTSAAQETALFFRAASSLRGDGVLQPSLKFLCILFPAFFTQPSIISWAFCCSSLRVSSGSPKSRRRATSLTLSAPAPSSIVC